MPSPFILSTWSFGPVANAAGFPVLAAGGSALDAAVTAASAVEIDPKVDSVGVGGLPDASGRLSLDASVMTDPDRCGSVSYVRGVVHPARLARAVMDHTMHVMLAGDGAEAFARAQGHPTRDPNALTDHARSAYLQWRGNRSDADLARYTGEPPPMNVEERYAQARSAQHRPEPSHDTVCVLARDARNQLAGVCTTSGLAFKMPGRVGDSPIIGSGLYVDQTAGAASATGNGELILGVCGSFLAVELMRQGRSPAEAIAAVLDRIRQRYRLLPDHQVALVAIRADGLWASGSLRPGFSHCHTDHSGTRLEPAHHVLIPAARST
jgi:N4-(beta-N-acetylglucosaminyl)-L-asparaginase